MEKNIVLSLTIISVLLPTLLISSINVQPLLNAQVGVQNSKEPDSPKNLTEALVKSQQKKATGYYQGESIRIFTVLNMYNREQWQPIDNYTSHGWEIKSIIPATLFQPGKQFLFIVLEKMPTK